MRDIILLKQGEIVLKGLNKRYFEQKLLQNVKRRLSPLGEFDVNCLQSTIYVEPRTDDADMDAALEALSVLLGRRITQEDRSNIQHIYTRVAGIPESGVYGGGSFERGGGGAGTVIDLSGYVDPSRKNAADLATFALHAWEQGWGYVWGTCGWVLTEEMLEAKLTQYPEGVGRYETIIRSSWLGGRTADCIGLIKGYGWLDPETLTIGYGTNGMPDISANQMFYAAQVSGIINTIPEVPGLAVWRDGHIAIYIGNGEIIEAMGTRYGVVKTQLSDGRFTHWLQIPFIDYDG